MGEQGPRKIKLDNAYTDTRGTNSYWRDPKDKSREKPHPAQNQKGAAADEKIWSYQYGKKSGAQGRTKAADLYENWMDDPTARAPQPAKNPEVIEQAEPKTKSKPYKSKYATDPIKPKSNFKYWQDYALDPGDSDNESGKGANQNKKRRKSQSNNNESDPDNGNNSDINKEKPDREQISQQPKDGNEERLDNNQADEGEEAGAEDLLDDNKQQSEKNLYSKGPNDSDISDIEDAYPDEPNDSKNYDPYATSGGMPPSPAKQVRKYPMKRRETAVQIEDDLAAAGLPNEAPVDRARKKGKSKKGPMKAVRRDSDANAPPGSVRGSRKNSKDDLDVEMRKREKNKKETKNKKTRPSSAGRSPSNNKSPSGWLDPNKDGAQARSSSTGRGAVSPATTPKSGRKNTKKKAPPVWKPWSNLGREFGKKTFVDEDV